jgi:hypothetical protein
MMYIHWWEKARRADTWWRSIAFRLPRSLAYWCAIRVGSHATVGKYGNQIVPELLFVDALKRWDDRA